MRRRQTVPGHWLVIAERLGARLWSALERLPRGAGVLLFYHELGPRERARLLGRLRRIARRRGLMLVDEARGNAARVHDLREIRTARLNGASLLFLSPIFATRSHPEMPPLPRMRAAALARLSGGRAIALGGMNGTRFRAVRALGFQGWAGIDAWTARIRT